MRLLRAVLAATLAIGSLGGGVARAEVVGDGAVKPETPPYRLVRIIADTHQALLFDKARGTHVLVDVGDAVGSYDVIEIDDDQIVLARPGEGREYVLVAGETSAPTSRVADPYPSLPPPPGEITFSAAMLLDPYPDGPSDLVADPEPVVEPAVEPPAPPPPPPTSFTVTREQLDAELGDFDAIGASVEMWIVEGGVELTVVAAGSFFHRMGLRDGDLVRAVDGTAIRGLDEAATVYARLATASAFAVELTRNGAPLTLRYTISAK